MYLRLLVAENLQHAEKDALTKMREPKLHFLCLDVVDVVNGSRISDPPSC